MTSARQGSRVAAWPGVAVTVFTAVASAQFAVYLWLVHSVARKRAQRQARRREEGAHPFDPQTS